ncbi:hypothetical protein BOTNAR_0228g00010 [Botryotinia narcissicola]|uniref:Uncharacterized protein n=1 Tax=Botryotinia narcissicola TaxID=278944 RepID=A0A4Z1I9P6_9HELO|nr:hypothetical protein BOTNAR_0228g00010 [Botryotinia narcissicola]
MNSKSAFKKRGIFSGFSADLYIQTSPKNTTKFKPDIQKLPPRVQKSQDLKNSEENEQSQVKRKYFDTNSSESEEEITKPAKKPKTTKAGMNFENVSTKRKHTEEVETSGPVKKQKITEAIKKPVAAPVKRAPIKEMKVRNNPTKNLLGFGDSKSTKKPAGPKKGSMQPRSVSEAANENGEKSTENALKSVSAQVKPKAITSQSNSAAPSTGKPSRLQYLNMSMEELFGEAPSAAAQSIKSPQSAVDNASIEELFSEAPLAAVQPTKTPRSAFDNTPPRSAFDRAPVKKTKSKRRGPIPASKVEVTKSSASSRSMSTMASNKAAQQSRRKVAPDLHAEFAKPSASIHKPPPASTSTSDKAQSTRRGATPASKDEVTRKVPSSNPLTTSSSSGKVLPSPRRAVSPIHVELKKPSISPKSLSTKTPTNEAGRSTLARIKNSTSAPRKMIKKGNKTDGAVPTPRSPVVDRLENTKDNMKDKCEAKKVEILEQPKLMTEINRSRSAALNNEVEVAPETKISEDIISFDPKVVPSSQAQRPMPQFLEFPGLPAANSDKWSVMNDFFKFENAKETFKTITPNTELSDAPEARDTMELELEREIQIEHQNSFHAEQLRTALGDLIALRAENGESDEYYSGDESDEEQCKVPRKIPEPTVLYKGYNGVLQEEPFYARDRGYESDMSDADEDKTVYYQSPYFEIAYQRAHPYIPGSVFNIPITRKPVSSTPTVPKSVLDELEAEMERCLEAQMAEDAVTEEESSPPVIPRSAFDNFEAEDNFLSAERHQKDYSEEMASAPIKSSVTSVTSVKSTNDFEGDFQGVSFEFNDASGQESVLTEEDPCSLLDTSFTFSNAMEMPVEQSSTSEGGHSDYTKESSDRPEEQTPRSESPEMSAGPYAGLDGCVGLTPLEDFPDESEDCDESSESDVEDSEKSESDESDIITIDDTTPKESDEDGDLENLDKDEDAELYQKHRVPADLANVEITMEPTELQLLKAKT